MKTSKTHARRRAALSAAATVAPMVLGALVLAGCAATHVGEDWQCPVAQGSVCASVAAADPAVPETAGPARLATRTPLYRTQGNPGAPGTEAAPGAAAGRGCEAGCDPFGWLARLFAGGANAHGGDAPGTESAVSVRADPAAAAVAADPESAVPGSGPAPAGVAASPGDVLREPETLARVWIAPFVDAGGVYREGAWVRLAIAPARWRLP